MKVMGSYLSFTRMILTSCGRLLRSRLDRHKYDFYSKVSEITRFQSRAISALYM